MSVSKPSLPGLISEIPQRRGLSEEEWSSSTLAPLQFSLVIPTYNERHNLRSLIERLSQLLDRLLGPDYE
ncbi:MAG: glycosyltransferase family 2 protein, partial [Phormidium sp. GEM2.Bin31]